VSVDEVKAQLGRGLESARTGRNTLRQASAVAGEALELATSTCQGSNHEWATDALETAACALHEIELTIARLDAGIELVDTYRAGL
jgi:exopolyphosphatase/pppGpp-phosphohydrolase